MGKEENLVYDMTKKLVYNSKTKRKVDKLKKDIRKEANTGGMNYILGGITGLILVVILLNSVTMVAGGHRGVLLEFAKPTLIIDEGLSFRIPFVTSVVDMNVRTLKYETECVSASKDMQDVKTSVALNYHLDADDLMNTYSTIGNNAMISETIIAPAIQEAVKSSTAKYNAEELITERPMVKQEIENVLKKRLSDRGISSETLSITNFEFGAEFNAAIESKQVAQQNALKSENDLQRIRIEAEQVKVEAEGIANATLTIATAEAQAIIIQGEALSNNQDVVALRIVEKWDGKYPQVVAGENNMLLNLGINQQ